VSRTALQIAQAPPLETQEQQALFAWADLMSGRIPELQDMYAVPNASRRSLRIGAQMKREGMRAGVPDIVLPHARGGYHALYIEMKRQRVKGERVELRAGTRPGEKQRQWHERLQAAGNRVCVCYGWEDAKGVIEQYLKMPSIDTEMAAYLDRMKR
jgi:hypothetical protein